MIPRCPTCARCLVEPPGSDDCPIPEDHNARAFDLSDGSVALIEPIDHRSSLVSRYVAGRIVWGQAFSSDTHGAQLTALLESMDRDPIAYVRSAWDATGRAR